MHSCHRYVGDSFYVWAHVLRAQTGTVVGSMLIALMAFAVQAEVAWSISPPRNPNDRSTQPARTISASAPSSSPLMEKWKGEIAKKNADKSKSVGRDVEIAQPKYVTPTTSVLDRYRVNVPSKVPGIYQPQHLVPVKEPSRLQFKTAKPIPAQPVVAPGSDEVVISDMPPSGRAPFSPSTTPVPTAKQENMPKSDWSTLWQGLAGTNSTDGSTVPATTTPPLPSASATHPNQSTQNSGKGLLWQLLGTNPQPADPSPSAPPTPLSGLADPFLMRSDSKAGSSPNQVAQASAERPAATNSTTATATEPARAANELATAATETPAAYGLLNQLGFSSIAPAPAPPASGGASKPDESAASALWRPFGMTNDAPAVSSSASPAESATANASDTRRLPESERVPSLLRPFYATNPPSSGGTRGAAASTAQAAASQSLTDSIGNTSLARQLAMLSHEDLRSNSNMTPDPAMLSEHKAWDGTLTIQWPLMDNPFLLTDVAERASTGGDGTVQVAFLQNSLPAAGGSVEPDDLDLPSEQQEAEEDAASGAGEQRGRSAGGETQGANRNDSLAGADRLGDAPQDNTLEFLRTQTVLLEPGKMQFDIGLEYTLTENEFPILLSDGMGNIVDVADVAFKARELAVPMELRLGLLKRVQVFLQVPVGWSNTQVSFANVDAFANDGGIGDVAFGATVQLRDAEKDCPYIIGTFSALAPTGGDPFIGVADVAPSAPSLGSGFWALAGSLTWIQTRYDPVVVFYGLGTRYQFSHEYIGIDFQPGPEYNYTLGAGFAVNERVTLSTQFFGAYIEELKANGDRIEGSNQEPMNLRMAATFVNACERIVEPFVNFGLTDDAVSANIGITWTY